MGLLDWLFGKKSEAAGVADAARQESARAQAPPPASHEPPRPAAPPAQGSSTPLADNLRRWRQTGQPRSWVEARRGQWGHAEWLALLDELKRSPYWPLDPDSVGLVLEETKREWLKRN